MRRKSCSAQNKKKKKSYCAARASANRGRQAKAMHKLFCFGEFPVADVIWRHRYPQFRSQRFKLRSHEHCEVNYLGRLEIIHFENIVGTRSSLRRISGVDSSGTTPGGGLGDTPYFNSLRIVVGTQSVLANPLHILQPCAVGYPRKEYFPTSPLQALGGLTTAHRRQKQGKFTAFTGLVIMEALPSLSWTFH